MVQILQVSAFAVTMSTGMVGRLARTMASAVWMSYAIQTVLMLTNSRMPYSESSRP